MLQWEAIQGEQHGQFRGGCVMLLHLSDWNVNVSLSFKNKKGLLVGGPLVILIYYLVFRHLELKKTRGNKNGQRITEVPQL